MARYLSWLAIIPCLMASYAMAEEEQVAEQPPLTYSQKAQQVMTKLKPVSTYMGVGLFDDMLNVNVESVTDLGNFYFRTGKFLESHAGAAFNMGWRYPVTSPRDASGYFVGAFLGQVMASSYNGEEYHRNGAGLDISYQWVNQHTRKTISVGMGSGFSRKADGSAKDGVPAGPKVFVSFSTALKVFD
ncbi:MAG: hypothetical protein KDI00_05575 [Pseudomonadales bacterium]|nr:hypothetical protein [Pseudomonadales bacterium]